MKISSWNIGILIQEGLEGEGLFCFVSHHKALGWLAQLQ